METATAVQRLSALAQPARLAIFRLLVKAGPAGLPAGVIAHRLKTAANTLSAQLLVLSQAGLIRSRRDGRSIIYAADFTAMRRLLTFLTEDCCGGDAALCAPPDVLARTGPTRTGPTRTGPTRTGPTRTGPTPEKSRTP